MIIINRGVDTSNEGAWAEEEPEAKDADWSGRGRDGGGEARRGSLKLPELKIAHTGVRGLVCLSVVPAEGAISL